MNTDTDTGTARSHRHDHQHMHMHMHHHVITTSQHTAHGTHHGSATQMDNEHSTRPTPLPPDDSAGDDTVVSEQPQSRSMQASFGQSTNQSQAPLQSQLPGDATHGRTRDRLLHHLKRADGLTADQLAEELGISTMAVRKHLVGLEREGLVSANVERRPVGRPARVYHLTDASDDLFPSAYDTIAVEFLSDLIQIDGADKVDLLFSRRAERTFSYLQERVERESTFAARVAALANGMDELGYLASVEEVAPGEYVLNQYNCAIQRIACVFPEACRYELDTYERLLGVEVERTCHLMTGDHRCCYVIRERSDSTSA